MKTFFNFIFLVFTTLIFSCNKNYSPLEEQENLIHNSDCIIGGIEIEFVDTCSYEFITTFISAFDSIKVTDTYLGCTFYLYADSADYNYWLKYFENDSTIQSLIFFNSADSLILKIRLTGKKSTEEERQRFLRIKNLKIIKIKEYPKLVYIDVPENTESEWVTIFNQYAFISHVYIMGVCFLS
jgi:hypothetical protein